MEENNVLNNEIVNEQQPQGQQGQSDDSMALIKAMQEMKEKSVSKEKYEKVLQERDGLIEALKSGQQITLVEPQEEESIDELRTELYGDPDKPWRATEYVEKTLKLREKVMANGERDPFLPNGNDYQVNSEDERYAQLTAQTFQECVDYAQGDDQLFVNELMRRTKDDNPIQKLRNRR